MTLIVGHGRWELMSVDPRSGAGGRPWPAATSRPWPAAMDDPYGGHMGALALPEGVVCSRELSKRVFELTQVRAPTVVSSDRARAIPYSYVVQKAASRRH